MKEFIKTRSKMFRLTAFILAFVVAVTCIPFPAKAGNSGVPTIGEAVNVADTMWVVNNGTIVTEAYHAGNPKTLSVGADTRALFDKISFGDTNTYYYSANIEANAAAYQSVQLTLGYGKDSEGNIRKIDVCSRPTGDANWQNVLFLNGTNVAEVPVAVTSHEAPANTSNYEYTVKYEQGAVSLWLNGSLVIDSVSVAGHLTDITLQPGVYTQGVAATVSDIQIWGDVKEAENVADAMTVVNNGNDYTKTYYSSTPSTIPVVADTKGTLGNITFGQKSTYYYSATIEGNMAAWQSARLVLGYGKDSAGNTRYIEVCSRPTGGAEWQSVIFLRGDAGEDVANNGVASNTPPTNVSKYNYTVKYEQGKISFWVDNTRIFEEITIMDKLTDVTIQPGVYTQGASATFSNIAIWGDVTTTLPIIKNEVNVVNEATIINNGANITQQYAQTKKIDVVAETTGHFENLAFGETDTYYYQGNIHSKGSAWQSVRLVLGTGKDSDGKVRTIEVCSRPTDGADWQNVIFLRGDAGEDTATNGVSAVKAPTNLSDYKYTVKYESGKITFWLNETLIFNEVSVTDRLSDIVLKPGFYAQYTSGTISDIAIWGDVTAVSNPEPTIGEATNAADYMTITNNGADATSDYQTNKVIQVNAGDAEFANGTFGKLAFGNSNSYNYAATLKMTEDKTSSYGSLRLVLGKGKMGETEGTLEVAVRPNQDDIVLFFHGNGHSTPENVIIHRWGKVTEIAEDITCTVKYANGIVSFWMNHELIFENVNLTTGEGTDSGTSIVTDVMLEPGFCAQRSVGTISDIKIWGDVQKEKTPEPTIGESANAADYMTVTNNDTDVTDDYRENSVININSGNATFANGTFGKLVFGETNSYNYSATVKMVEDKTGGNYGSVRMVLGKGKLGDTEGMLEVAVRQGDVVLFFHEGTHTGGETPIVHVPGTGNALGESAECTVKYENGVLSFWMNHELIFENVNLITGVGTIDNKVITDIILQPGFCAQQCIGTISNIKIWGDVTKATEPDPGLDPEPTTPEPVIGNNENAAIGVTVVNNGLDYTKQYESNGNIEITTDTRGDFGELKFGNTNTYYYSTVVEAQAQSWKSVRTVLGYGNNADNIKRNIELCIRPKDDGGWQAVLFLTADAWGEGYDYEVAVGAKDVAAPKDNAEYRYTAKYETGKVSFWLDSELVFENLNVNDYLSNITLQPGFYAQGTTGKLSNIQLWGDVEATREAGYVDPTTVEPMIGTAENAADKMVVLNNGINTTNEYRKTESIHVDANTAGIFKNLEFSGDSYVYSADVTYIKDSSEYGSIRLRVGSGLNKNKAEQQIEICIRPNLDQAIIFLNGWDEKAEISEVIVGDFVNVPNIEIGKTYRHTVKYEGGKLSFWLDGEQIFKEQKIDLSDITLAPGFYSQNCTGSLSNVKIWGDITGIVAPEFDEVKDVNLIPQVVVTDVFSNRLYKLASCKLSSLKGMTGRVDFKGITLQGDYTFYADASFSDNKEPRPGSEEEYNWEGIIFRVATASKAGKECVIEVRVRNNMLLVFAVEGDGKEQLILQNALTTAFDKEKSYVLDYHKDGSFDFWQDGIALIRNFDLAKYEFKNIAPVCGIGAEVCNFAFRNMKLVNPYVTMPMQVPKKPETNGDYADTMRVLSNAVIKYEDGKIISTTDEMPASTEFKYLPFKPDETYVYGFNLTTEKADLIWKGVRIILGMDKSGNEIKLYTMQNEIGVFVGDEQIGVASLPRELGTDYRFDILIEPKAVTVWVNDILMLERCKTPEKASAKTGVAFEYAKAVMSNIDLYYTDIVEYVKPDVPEAPVLKEISSSQYNAADWMNVTLDGANYGGYFGNKLSANNSKKASIYLFEDIPVTDDMSYYYSGTYTVHESSVEWKGPRFIFRYAGNVPMYVAVTHNNILILAGGEQVAAAPLKMEKGKAYDIVIYSTPKEVTVWVDGQLMFESLDLSAYSKGKNLVAKLGILFEFCKADVKNLAIYGDKIVFNEEYVDIELYNDKYYKMAGIPEMPDGGKNLFQNITMIDQSEGSLGAEFDKDNNVLQTTYNNGTGDLVFVDANGSSNLNGLRNESAYVFSFKYKVDDWKAEKKGDTGLWMTLNRSEVPSTTLPNEIKVGISGDALMIKVYKDGQIITDQIAEFSRQNGKEYDIAVVHGRNWIKFYVDNELKMVSKKLPTYNVEFTMNVTNTKSAFTDFKLYEFEDSGLEILKTVEKAEVTTTGNTIFDAKEFSELAGIKMPVLVMAVSAIVVIGSVVGIVSVVRSNKKNRKKEEE